MYYSFVKFGKCSLSIQIEVYKEDFDNISFVNIDVINIELDEWEVLYLMLDGL